jgi:hypothetical protein
MREDSLLAFIAQALHLLPVAVGVLAAASVIGPSERLICQRSAARKVSCYHQAAFFGVGLQAEAPFGVTAAAVETYRVDASAEASTAHRIVLTSPSGKSFFYYGPNDQKANLELERLRDLLAGEGASSLQLESSLPLAGGILMMPFLLFGIYMGRLLTKVMVFYLFGFTENREGSLTTFYLGLFFLPVSLSGLAALMIVQSDQLTCRPAEGAAVRCDRRVVHLFGTWSRQSELRVQQAAVQEDYSEDGFGATYGLLLTTADKQICYGCRRRYLSAHQSYSGLNAINDRLSGKDSSTLALNYQQSRLAQLLVLIASLTLLPLMIVAFELLLVGFAAMLYALFNRDR